MSVLLIGTLDTKGVEVGYVRDRLRAAGVAVTVADAGVLGPPGFAPRPCTSGNTAMLRTSAKCGP